MKRDEVSWIDLLKVFLLVTLITAILIAIGLRIGFWIIDN